MNCFFYIVTFTAWVSENCQGGIKCAAVSFSSQENFTREEEGGPQLLVWMGICSDFNGAGSKIVKGFLCLPLLILYLLCSCVITLLTTYRLILFNFVCMSFSFPSHILFALLAVNLPLRLYPAILKVETPALSGSQWNAFWQYFASTAGRLRDLYGQISYSCDCE